jgi:hypothetical protein
MEPFVKTLCTAVLLLTAACHLGESSSPASPTPAGGIPSNLVLRTYEVPGGAAAQVRAVLKDVFWIGSDGKDSNKFLGRSDIGPDGRLVVMASEGVQDGVQTLIESLGKHPPKPAPTIDTTYWVVFATPGKGGGALPPGLNEVAPALQQIEKSDGPQQFTLGEKLVLTQISGEAARIFGRETEVRQTASVTGNAISTEISLERRAQRIETRVNLTPGQTLVLSSSGATPLGKDEATQAMYVLLRTGIHDGQAQ